MVSAAVGTRTSGGLTAEKTETKEEFRRFFFTPKMGCEIRKKRLNFIKSGVKFNFNVTEILPFFTFFTVSRQQRRLVQRKS